MNSDKSKKLYETYILFGELLLQYPDSLDEVLNFLLDAKEFYQGKKNYEMQKKKTQESIEQEYVVFEDNVENTNG